MFRTQVYLTDEAAVEIRLLAEVESRNQSEIIRSAIDAYLDQHRTSARRNHLLQCAGLWADRDDLPTAQALRESWERDFHEL